MGLVPIAFNAIRTRGRLSRLVLLIPSWESLAADPEEKRGPRMSSNVNVGEAETMYRLTPESRIEKTHLDVRARKRAPKFSNMMSTRHANTDFLTKGCFLTSAALDRAVEECRKYPFPQRDQLDRIAMKLRYLGITAPEDRLCDEAQGGLGYILSDIADEIAGVTDDLHKDCDTRLAAIIGKREAQS